MPRVILGIEIVLDLETKRRAQIPARPCRRSDDGRSAPSRPGDERRRPNAFERGDAACPLLRSVHAARIELHNAFSIRQAAVADAGLFRIELDDVDAGDQRVEHVVPFDDLREGYLDAVLSPPFLNLLPLADEMTMGLLRARA